jgi:hypothetical protein
MQSPNVKDRLESLGAVIVPAGRAIPEDFGAVKLDQSCEFICFTDAKLPAHNQGSPLILAKSESGLHPGGTNWSSSDSYQNQPDLSGPRRHQPRKMHSARFS